MLMSMCSITFWQLILIGACLCIVDIVFSGGKRNLCLCYMIVILKLTFDLMFGGGTGIHCSSLYDGDFKCNFSIFNFMNSLNHTTKL